MDELIEPVRLEWIEALVVGDGEFTAMTGRVVAPGWEGFPEVLPHVLAAAHQRDQDPWGSHLIFDRTDAALIGLCGFKGPPVRGAVEIGYAVAPEHQGRGVASRAAAWLVDVARTRGVSTVTAHTLPETNASTTVLALVGFVHVGIYEDPDEAVEGPVWRWEIALD